MALLVNGRADLDPLKKGRGVIGFAGRSSPGRARGFLVGRIDRQTDAALAASAETLAFYEVGLFCSERSAPHGRGIGNERSTA